MVLSSSWPTWWLTKVIARVRPVHLMTVDWALGGRQPSEQDNRLGSRVRQKLAATVHIHLSVVIISQPISRYSFYRPTEGGGLSRPSHCCKCAQPVPKAVYRSSCCDKHNRPRCDSNLGPHTAVRHANRSAVECLWMLVYIRPVVWCLWQVSTHRRPSGIVWQSLDLCWGTSSHGTSDAGNSAFLDDSNNNSNNKHVCVAP